MAIDFPNNPLDGNTYTYEGVKYTFKDTGSGGYWYLKDLGTATAATTADVNAGTDNTKYVTSDSLSGSTYDTRITSNANSITSLSNSKANASGTYSGLRAQATTQADVGLSLLANKGTATSVNSNSSGLYVTSNVTNQIYNLLPTRAGYASVGQVAFLSYVDSTGGAAGAYVYANNLYAGGLLTHAGVRNNLNAGTATGSVGLRSATGSRMSGTWRALGYARSNGDYFTPPTTLFVRIS